MQIGSNPPLTSTPILPASQALTTAPQLVTSSGSSATGLAGIDQHALTRELVSIIQSNQDEVAQDQALQGFQEKLGQACKSISDQDLSQLNHEFKNLEILNPTLTQTPLLGFGMGTFNKISNNLLAKAIERYCQAKNLNHKLSQGLQLYFEKDLNGNVFYAQGDNTGESRPTEPSTISDLIVSATKFGDLELLQALANQAKICEPRIPFAVFSLNETIAEARSAIPTNLTNDTARKLEAALTTIANNAESTSV